MKHFSLIFIIMMLISCSDKDTKHSENTNTEHQDTNHTAMNISHWNAPKSETTRTNPVKRDQLSIARGLALYKTNCLACHGEHAKGNGPAGVALNPKPANLAQMSGKHPDGDFAWKIATGRGVMPPWKATLSENDIWDVVNYIQSLATNNQPTDSQNNQH